MNHLENDPVSGIEDIRSKLRIEMPYLREHFGVASLGVFGSYARGDQTEESDIDVLVTFTEKPGMFTFVALAEHLEALLGRKVDLMTRDSLDHRKRLAFYVLREVQAV